MITQIVEMTDSNANECRVVGEIDVDRIFWAYVEVKVDGVWVRDDGVVSYQRDSVVVPNIEHDPDVLLYFAGQGVWKHDYQVDFQKELDFVRNTYPTLS